MNIALRPVFTAQSQQKKEKKTALIIKVAPRYKTNNLFVDSTLKKRNIKENLFKIKFVRTRIENVFCTMLSRNHVQSQSTFFVTGIKYFTISHSQSKILKFFKLTPNRELIRFCMKYSFCNNTRCRQKTDRPKS